MQTQKELSEHLVPRPLQNHLRIDFIGFDAKRQGHIISALEALPLFSANRISPLDAKKVSPATRNPVITLVHSESVDDKVVKEYSNKGIPVAVLSERIPMSECSRLFECGISWIFDVPLNITEQNSYDAFSRLVLRRIFLSDVGLHSPLYHQAYTFLESSKPISVEDWTSQLNVSNRHFRRVCSVRGFQPGFLLRSYAFLIRLLNCQRLAALGIDTADRESPDYSFFWQNRSSFMHLISV